MKIKLLVVLILSLSSFAINADERLYKIELVIFEQDMPNTEVFDQTESQIVWPKKVVDRLSYQQVDTEFLMLKDSYRKLARSRNYRPLMHVAWIQKVKSNQYSTAVQITNPEKTINGFFRLQRGNLVHMIADIEYSSGDIIFRLNEKRRFKLNETHYLDHPQFGVIARVSPVIADK